MLSQVPWSWARSSRPFHGECGASSRSGLWARREARLSWATLDGGPQYLRTSEKALWRLAISRLRHQKAER